MSRWLLVPALAAAAALPAGGRDAPAAYTSPYSVAFSYPHAELVGDLEKTPRGDPREQSAVPFASWYAPHARKEFGAWGPPARHYPAAAAAAGKPAKWLRERLIAVALRFEGYGYQHHHVPDWEPPRGWPWKETAVGRNGKGVDCSNFAAFAYNQGFGIKPSSDIHKLSEEREFPGPGPGRATRAERVELPAGYDERVAALKTGDMLFVRSNKGVVSHVVLWVGPVGRSPDGVPLVLDSHGEGVKDSNGEHIPAGVRLRPFRKDSWYAHSASHATRVFAGE